MDKPTPLPMRFEVKGIPLPIFLISIGLVLAALFDFIFVW